MNRQQQQISQTQQSQQQYQQSQQVTQQRVSRTEQHVTRQITGHSTGQSYFFRLICFFHFKKAFKSSVAVFTVIKFHLSYHLFQKF